MPRPELQGSFFPPVLKQRLESGLGQYAAVSRLLRGSKQPSHVVGPETTRGRADDGKNLVNLDYNHICPVKISSVAKFTRLSRQ